MTHTHLFQLSCYSADLQFICLFSLLSLLLYCARATAAGVIVVYRQCRRAFIRLIINHFIG